ncbi:putative DNA (cytosine-5)-methyltransferase 3B [Scophthalmus maximus]|uniref:DNA (cytosine-5-)-methyltransferase n=1 Tax=Scophthalmus maximus TaxID=52904 RepID=A0A2U9C2X2_SCOMX|nr:putative DNA (cytosine-5)-methyltransferase 3B [Scophthalmus maximus]
MAVNVEQHSYSRYELLAWLNETLQTGFTQVEQVCTGAAYCQLMDWLCPGSLDLSRVRFQSNKTVDSIHNYSLLQAAFRTARVVRHIPIEALIKRNPTVALTFLQWFKMFFDENNKGREYHALEARGGQSMNMVAADSDDLSSPTPHQKLEIIVKMEGKTVEEQKEEKPGDNLNRNADVVLISDDDEDNVMDVMMEPKMEISEKEQCAQETKRVELKEETEDKRSQGNGFCSSDTLLRFIRRYCCDNVDSNSTFSTSTGTQNSISAILSPSHLKDIIQACSDTPYCLYLYMGVELGEGQSTSVVLIGYFDQNSGVSVVRPLDTLQMSVDIADLQASAADTLAYSDAKLLVDMLSTSGLSLPNLAVFYCNAPHPQVSHVFVSQLQAFNPSLLSLCGLPGMAGRACQAALSASFSCVVYLVREIHHHYSSYPSVNDSLKELFAGEDTYNPSHPVSEQCLFIIRTVQKMVDSWRDLVEYFKSLMQMPETDWIITQLMDYKVKLHFLFLSQSMEPLRALQEVQQYGTADVASELQLTSILLESYAGNILRPPVAEHFLRRPDLYLLHNGKELLPMTDANVGSRARDFLWGTAVVDLGEQERSDFLKCAGAFYRAALQSIVLSIPEQLGNVVLKHIATLLKLPEKINDKKLSRHVLSELGVQLGVCNARSPETHQLAYGYLSVMKTLKWEQTSTAGEAPDWAKMLNRMRPFSTLHRLFLTFLALPSSLCRKQVFSKVICSTKGSPRAPPQRGSRSRRPRIRRTRIPVQRVYGRKKTGEKEEDEGSSSDDSNGSMDKSSLQITSKHYSRMEESDYTDNSSDVVDVTGESEEIQSSIVVKAESKQSPQAEIVVMVSSGGEDGGEDDNMVSTSTPSDSAEFLDAKGALVWGKAVGFSLWPAINKSSKEEYPLKMVEWYGQKLSSLVRLETLKPLAAFSQHFCSNSFATLVTYREAIFLSLEEAALRCKKRFSASPEDRDELLKQMMDWAFEGFQPSGPDGFKPTSFINGDGKTCDRPKVKRNVSSSHSFNSSAPTSKETICRITDMKLDIEGFCLCCGSENTAIFHPLFKGSLCLECKNNFTDTLFRYDEDGYQSYCTICCYGLEVILCGNDSCCRSYCADCLNILAGPGTFHSLKPLDPWICFLCQPHRSHGALTPREDWSIRVQEFFANNSAMEFEPHRVYPSIPANLRRPVRVLSLFDGIATGYLVLKDLGFKVEKYVASEVCEDSLAVAVINHDAKIIHVGDVRFITQENIEQWGPFDLLIGGSPCNDLSIVNPIRKGLYEGTGRLFFEYYRILQLLKPKEEDPRPFFWLFENVVFMNTHDKVNICRFLECNPVLVDAVKVSPAHRARYFWGNIPGMSRPIVASQNDRLSLQDCLEIGREARVTKVRTITTNPNSLKQGKNVSLLPVLQNGKDDNLWITELERIFGFPKHYTDVRNMNRQQRQKVLGKAWSVPVIRHLFAPLKDYFACEELLTTSTTSTSLSSTSLSFPASPELQQLR